MSAQEDRLELLDAELSKQVERASDEQRRRAARAACEYALSRVRLGGELVDEAVRGLDDGQFGASRLLTLTEQLTETLDAEYFDLQEKAHAGQAEEAAFLTAFKKARAANALHFALKRDSLEAAREAIYEANAATDDLAGLKAAVLAAIQAV